MRNLGVHAGLALAGVIAGLPVAAVLQWHREPPSEMWNVKSYRGADPEVWPGVLVGLADEPGGHKVTSISTENDVVVRQGDFTLQVGLRPSVLRLVGRELARSVPPAWDVIEDRALRDAVINDGVMWCRVRVIGRP